MRKLNKMKDKQPFRLKDRFLSFKYAWEGVIYMIRNEHNTRIHLLSALLVVLFSFYFDISSVEWTIVIICIALVISMECLNTAIERMCDEITLEKNPAIKIAKDVAAAAVLTCAIAAAVIGLIIFIPYLMVLI